MTRTYKHWTTKEEELLREWWITETPVKEFLHLFEGRSYGSVLIHANNHMGMGRRPTMVRSTYSPVWVSVERLLKTGVQMNAKDIAAYLRVSARRVTDVLVAHHKGEEKAVHIATWRRAGDGWNWVQIWAIGDGPDMRKPRPQTNDDRARRKRAQRAACSSMKSHGVFGLVVSQLNQASA